LAKKKKKRIRLIQLANSANIYISVDQMYSA